LKRSLKNNLIIKNLQFNNKNMNNNDLKEILKRNISNIEKKLEEKAKELFEKKNLELRKQTKLLSFENTKEELINKRELLEKQIEDIDDLIFDVKSKIKGFQKNIPIKNIDKDIYELLKLIK